MSLIKFTVKALPFLLKLPVVIKDILPLFQATSLCIKLTSSVLTAFMLYFVCTNASGGLWVVPAGKLVISTTTPTFPGEIQEGQTKGPVITWLCWPSVNFKGC